jgi:hypothetical protein
LTSLGQSGALVKAFAEYLLSDEVQSATSGHLGDFGFFPLPASLLTATRQSVSNIVIAGDATAYAFETKGTTQVNVGAGMYMLSGKREGWNSHVLEDFTEKITSSAATDLEHGDTIADLLAKIVALNATVNAMPSTADDDDGDNNNTVAVIAIVLAIIALVCNIGTYFALKGNAGSSNSSFNNPSYTASSAKANSADNGDGYMDVTGTEQKSAV